MFSGFLGWTHILNKLFKKIVLFILGKKITYFFIYGLQVKIFRIIMYIRKLRLGTITQFIEHGDADHHVFFGYYDLTPFGNNDLLLATRTSLQNKTPTPDRRMEIGYYKLNEEPDSFHQVGVTTTWCWQQGCRLQWYSQDSKYILYNKIVDGKYGCVIQDIESRQIIRLIHRPIYSISNDGNWGLSLNFSRLQRLRPGYGYVNFPDYTKGQLSPENDGIWRIEMKTGKQVMLFSISEICRFDPLPTMYDAEHYFNHIQFNPSGNRFLFFHIWLNKGNRFSRLITCNIDGSRMYPLINEGHVSHYNWKSNSEIIAYSTHQKTGSFYHIYKDQTENVEVLAPDILDRDGHPSFSPDGNYLLTDTYPDKYGEQHLLLYNIEKQQIDCIGSYYRPVKFIGEQRCDLHPRWSPEGNMICYDSSHRNLRKMCVINKSDIY